MVGNSQLEQERQEWTRRDFDTPRCRPYYPPAMSDAPRLDVAALSRRGAAWNGVVRAGQLERLSALVGEADVSVSLRFALDESGRARVTGRCCFVAQVLCSGCLRDDSVEVECAVDLRVVATEAEARTLMPQADSVVHDAKTIAVSDLIEDDLLMSVPEFACNDRAACFHAASVRASAVDGGETAATGPFASLAALKTS